MTAFANALTHRTLRSALALFLLINTLSIYYGFQYKWLRSSDSFHYKLLFSLAFLILLIFLTYSAVHERAPPFRLGRAHGRLGFFLTALSFTLTLFFQSKIFYGGRPWYEVAIGAVFFGALIHRAWGARGSTRFFAFCGMLFMLHYIENQEVWLKGDMLLVIEAAGREFLSGNQPYRAYPEVYRELAHKQPFGVRDINEFAGAYRGASVPMQYLPGLWLAYLPAVALDMDLRFMNVLFAGCLVAAVERLFREDADRSIALSLTFYPFLLSPAVLGVITAVHLIHYWLFLMVVVFGIRSKDFMLAAIFLGLALGTRQGSLFIIPPLVAYFFPLLGWRKMFRYGVVVVCVYLMLTLPFAFWLRDDFLLWRHLYFSLTSLSVDVYRVTGTIGATDVLRRVGAGSWAALIQFLLVMCATAIILILRNYRLCSGLQLIGLAYVWAVFFNPYSVRYEYYAGILLLLAGVAKALAETQWKGEDSRRGLCAPGREI